MRLSEVCIRRPVFTVMLIGGFVGLGLLSLPRLGIDLFPRVEFPIITVSTVLEGAAPETVEREVTQILEESINTIEGIRTLSSASMDSLSLIYVEFELEYDVREKAQEVRDKVAAARGRLPRDLEPPVVNRIDPDAEPVLAIMLSGPHAIRTLTEFADQELKTRLERVPGVGSVTVVGGRPREIRIWIDPLRLAGYGLAIDDVIEALREGHVELPGGRFETGREEWTLKTLGKLTSVEQFGSLVVAERGGATIHLRDVTTVEDGMAEMRTLSRLNGRPGVSLLIRRQSGENTVAVTDAVKAELVRLQRDLPPGYEMALASDSSIFIRSAIRSVAIDMVYGIGLASLVVLLFLRNARSTLIAAVTIPSSVVASFTLFYAFGFTLNTMTLMALSLSIGLLIDDAIVVLENVYRHMETGEEGAVAASLATREIGLAVLATTFANCAVFIPIAFLSGVVGRFFREFGLVATFAVLVSTLVALSLTPMLCARYLRAVEPSGRVWRGIGRGHRWLEGHYRRALRWGLHHRAIVMGLAILAVLGGLWVARGVPIDFMIEEDRSEFNVWLKQPLGTGVEQTQEAVTAVEQTLREMPETRIIFSTIGAGAKQRVNEAQIYVQLVHKSERSGSQAELMARVRERIAGLELGLADFAIEEIPFIEVAGARSAQLMYAVRGPEVDRLHLFAGRLAHRLRATEGYRDVFLSYETGKPEIALDITRERAADLGVPVLQIGRTIASLYAGVEVGSYEEGGERYDVRVQVRPEYRDELHKLELVRVRSSSGALVPLTNLVTPRIGSGPVQIDREGRTRSITVYANLDGKAAAAADAEVSGFIRELSLPSGYEVVAIGPTERLRETTAAVIFAFVLALVAIYMILAAQFDSFVHPFTIMLSAPLSFLGAFAAVRLLGYSLDVMGQIAFLMLMGIVMKNGILLVDYTKTLRSRGLSRTDAILEAGPTRMRPVLMTATSTIFGMLPIAFGTGDGSEWRAPMGIVSIGGLAASTLLTLLVVPIVYSLFDEAGDWLRSLFARRRTAAAHARREAHGADAG